MEGAGIPRKYGLLLFGGSGTEEEMVDRTPLTNLVTKCGYKISSEIAVALE